MTHCTLVISVRGHVQGVGFRYFTQQKALSYHLTGYVKNLADSSVKIVASGKRENVDKLLNWLDQGGPALAKIDNYHVQSIDKQNYADFIIKY